MDEDEVGRLLRDREMLLAALGEVVEAHARLPTAPDASRWNAAVRQAESVYEDATRRQAGDGQPVATFFCELEGGHQGAHKMLPHAMRIIHATRALTPTE